MKQLQHSVGLTSILRAYKENDPIWDMPEEKQQRRLIADVQRDLTDEADRLVRRPVTVRG